jgi:hypothetical protein
MVNDNVSVRPSRLEKVKDEEYDYAWAQYILSRVFDWKLEFFRRKTEVNFMFVVSNSQLKFQWMFDEDVDTFLNDESGDPTYRVRWQDNIMAPVVRQYVGNAIRTSFEYRAVPLSENIKNRRDMELDRMVTLSILAQEAGEEMGEEFQEMLQEEFPIGTGPEDAERLFDGYYYDKLTTDVNNLIKVVASRNDLNGKVKKFLTKQLAISGLCVVYNKDHYGHQIFEPLQSSDFFWDISAQREDLSDSMFMGHKAYLDPTYIYEKYPDLTDEDKEQIEAMSQYQNNGDLFENGIWNGDKTGRITTYYSFWKDCDEYEFGCVIDEFGNEIFTVVNDEDGKYTDKDLIEPQYEPYQKILKIRNKKRVTKKNLKTKMVCDVIRYCVFIFESREDDSATDMPIVLESGIMPYQETSSLDPSNARFPYAVQTFELYNGLVVSPLDAMIDPQRMINRFWSAQEAQINRATPPVTVIDKNIVDPEEGEEGLRRNIRNGDPVLVNGKYGVNNSVVQLSGTRLDGFQYLSESISQVKSAALAITGVNEQMLGTGSLELVRNTQAMINRGTLIQEDFYFSIADVMKQIYQSIVSRGRKIYADSPHVLINAVGEDGADRIMFTRDDCLEDYRVDLQRSLPEPDLIEQGNALMMQLLQMGMLDTNTISKMLNMATPAEVYSASRRFLKLKQELEREQAEMQQVAAMRQEQAMEAQNADAMMMQLEQMESANVNRSEDRDAKIASELIKAGARQTQQPQPNQVL